MSAMKRHLLDKSEEVLKIIASFSKVHVALSTHGFIVVKAFHHMTIKSLVAKLTAAGFITKAQPFRNGRYNVLINTH